MVSKVAFMLVTLSTHFSAQFFNTWKAFFLSFPPLVGNHWSMMDGLCPPVRWVSSITSCSNQPLLLLATNPPPTDGHTPTRFSQLNPPRYHHRRRMLTTRPVSMSNNCQQSGKASARCPTTDLARPTRFAEHAWQSQIRVWFLLASLQLISFFPCQQNPPKKQGGVWSPQV